MPGSAPAFSLVDAGVSYEREPVLSDVDLAVRNGEFVAVLGGNGSGKTTLMRAMLGLTPLTRGTAFIHGVPAARFRDWTRIGYVPQRLVSGGAVPVSVDELVASVRASPRRRLRLSSAADRARAADALARMGLSHRRHDRFDTLSGGQQRRVLIARALAGGPDTLVLDEPTAGVDAESQAVLAAELTHLKSTGATVVLVTHELGEVSALADRVIVMGRNGAGCVRYDGPPPPPEEFTETWHHHDDGDDTARRRGPEPLLEER